MEKFKFCEEQIEKRFEMCTVDTEGKMKCDKIKQMLIEWEDSISNDWEKVMAKMGLKNDDAVGFEHFMKIYRVFRLEIE
jgi:Ca2+-binding EF-hand superfamily protein